MHPPARSVLWRLSFNSIVQIAGQLVPLLAAAAAIPGINRRVSGTDFGLFTLAISAIGFFSLMDFGIGRATVRFAARALAEGDSKEARAIASQSTVGFAVLSVVLGASVAIFGPAAAVRWLHAAGGSKGAIREVIYIIAIGVPFVGMSSVLRSILESRERFPSIALIQGSMGAATYIFPLVLACLTRDITVIIGGVVIARILGFCAYWAVALRYWSLTLAPEAYRAKHGREFRKFSKWLVVSNLVGNAIVYADRALLAGLVPLDQLPFYNVPLELISRLMIVVNGAVSVVFPSLSRLSVDRVRIDRVQSLAVIALGALAVPILLLCSAFAPDILQAWLGSAYRVHSTEIVRILLIGLLFLGMNAVSLASLNARGISKRIAVMHAIEAPVYLGALAYLGHGFGTLGIAIVWALRMVVEFVCYGAMKACVSEEPGLELASALLGAIQAAPLLVIALHLGDLPCSIALIVCLAAAVLWLLPRSGVYLNLS